MAVSGQIVIRDNHILNPVRVILYQHQTLALRNCSAVRGWRHEPTDARLINAPSVQWLPIQGTVSLSYLLISIFHDCHVADANIHPG
jgi:hypothetical protein